MPPADVPQGHAVYRFADTNEFRNLLTGADLTDVGVEDHKTTYLIPDVDTLWRGGLGSCALTGSAIAHQNAATKAAIRLRWNGERSPIRLPRASTYRSPSRSA